MGHMLRLKFYYLLDKTTCSFEQKGLSKDQSQQRIVSLLNREQFVAETAENSNTLTHINNTSELNRLSSLDELYVLSNRDIFKLMKNHDNVLITTLVSE